jgi:TolB protein
MMLFKKYFNLRLVTLSALLILLISGCNTTASSKTILYISELDGNPEIYSTNINAESHTRLTNSSRKELHPKLSPNGNKIGFLRSNSSLLQLWIMDNEGNEEKMISRKGEDVQQFFWSPDSQKISYKRKNSSGQHDVSLYDVSKNSITEVTSNLDVEQLGNWSPDGEWITYSIIKTSLNKEVSRMGIFKKNPEGVDEVQLTEFFEDHNARWSPDGKNIAFLSTREGDDLDIYVINVETKEETNLTTSEGNDYDFDWSSDGNRIVFISDREENPEIFVASVDGSEEPIRLTDNISIESSPIWNENKIIFISNSDGDQDLYSMTPSDGSNQKRLTETSESEYFPSWR